MIGSGFEWYRALPQDDAYWSEAAKQDFAVAVERLMVRHGIGKREFARELKTSPAYVTKVLRGDTNLTIDSMVKLARAVGGTVHIHVAPKEANVRWFEHWAERVPVAREGRVLEEKEKAAAQTWVKQAKEMAAEQIWDKQVKGSGRQTDIAA